MTRSACCGPYPGIGDLAAQAIVAEIGIDMGRFPTAAHLVSWAGLCPRSDESAGKRRSTRLRKGAPWLKTTLVQCAWAAGRRKDGYLRAQFRRLRQRRGPKKAVCAVAASMPTAIWHMLRDGTVYQDLGLPGPRGRPLPQALPRATGASPRAPDRQARLHLLHHARPQRGFCLGIGGVCRAAVARRCSMAARSYRRLKRYSNSATAWCTDRTGGRSCSNPAWAHPMRT